MNILKNLKNLENKSIKNLYVAYQGVEGAFSHNALKEVFGACSEFPCLSFEDVFISVSSGKTHFGILPIENSNTGEISEVLDLLKKYNCYINKIHTLKINQHLLGIKNSKIENIKQVFSHPQGFLQSSKFLKDKNWNLIPFHNTAISAKHVKDENNIEFAAIGSFETAFIYNLDILAENINDNNHNYTKFIVISNTMLSEGDTYSIILSTDHNVGSLSKIVNIISKYNFNMLNIKSRPNKSVPWEYYFYIELQGKDFSNDFINELKQNSLEFKIVGRYN